MQPAASGKASAPLTEIYNTFFGGKAEVFWVGCTQVCFEGERVTVTCPRDILVIRS